MRNHVIDKITELAKDDFRIMMLCADLGYSVLEGFRDLFPDRYINVGIAEQNMASVAAGLALEGNMVFTYSIGNFSTLRCIEQIRNDICYHNANVKILAVGGGFPYGSLGMTHHATEDIAMMRSLPNMKVYVPADIKEAIGCLSDAVSYDGPAYIRMAKGREENQYDEDRDIDVKKLISADRDYGMGADISIISCGTILSEAKKIKELLSDRPYNVSVYSCPMIKPIDSELIKKISINSKVVVTMEDHNIIGGLGGAVAEIMSDISGMHSTLLRIGLNDVYTSEVGSQDYLRDYYGLSARTCVDKILKCLE